MILCLEIFSFTQNKSNMFLACTLPETNIAPKNVSFREGKSLEKTKQG